MPYAHPMTASEPPSAIESLFEGLDEAEPTLVVVNRTEPVQFVNLLEGGLGGQSVTIQEAEIPLEADNVVCLVEDETVVATSPLDELTESYLLVNADRYRTGTRQIERGSFPDVLVGLDDVEFTLRGYPASAKEKLLLILISRYIEFRALEHGSGTLHSTFQRLSRLDDELGTRRVYRWLGGSDVDTHVYGVPDETSVVDSLDVTVHQGRSETYRRCWILVFRPPDARVDGAALLAVEQDDNVWRGMWTFDAQRVAAINEFVEGAF